MPACVCPVAGSSCLPLPAEQDKGCSGGLMDYAYQWVIQNGGIDTEDDYPYEGTEATCVLKKQQRKVVTIDGYQDVPENDEVALKKAAAHHPVAVAIEADAKSFQLYGGGVYDDVECGTSLNHGVLVVGYGRDKEQGSYWVVKNSWGAEWGDKGERTACHARTPAGHARHAGAHGCIAAQRRRHSPSRHATVRGPYVPCGSTC